MQDDSAKVSRVTGQIRLRNIPFLAGRAGAALIACLVLAAGGAQAQSAGGESPTGRGLTFSVSAGLAATDNPDFRRNPGDGELRASTDLGLRLRNDTALGSLVLDANTLLVQKFSGDDKGFERPRQGISLSYRREGVNAALDLKASLRESRIDFLRPLSDFIDENGQIDLPADLDDLTGTGWQRQTGIDTTLTLGRTARFGVILGAGLSETSYRDASNPTLEDSERRHASARMRFDVTPITRLDLALRYSIFEESGDRRETWSLDPGLAFERPDGTIRALLGVTRTEDGTRLSAEVGRMIERPWGRLDGRIGAVRLANGNTALSGGLRLTYALPRAQLAVALDRSAISGSDDDEVLRTALTVNYQQAVTEISSLSLNLAYVENDNGATGRVTDNASFGLGYNHALTEDWSVILGYNYRMRRESDLPGRTSENEVSVMLRRSLTFGF